MPALKVLILLHQLQKKKNPNNNSKFTVRIETQIIGTKLWLSEFLRNIGAFKAANLHGEKHPNTDALP